MRSTTAVRLALPAFLAISTLAISISCAPSSGVAPPTATVTPAPQGPRVKLPSSRVISLELARTESEKAQGLMFRESLEEDRGMVFLWDTAEVRPFWMKNCHFPLDIIYTRLDGTVVDVLANVPHCEADPCPSYPPRGAAETVVEVNAGVAARHGVKPGVRLFFEGVPGR